MKQIALFIAILVSAATVKAQTPLSFGSLNGGAGSFRDYNHLNDSNNLRKKWFITKTASLSSGFFAFSRGNGAFVSAPLGLQLNRQLSNNVYAFAGVSVAPTFLQFNNSFAQHGFSKNNGLFNANNFGVSSSVQMGLMYINNDRTFSISGSISRGNYSGNYPYYYNPAMTPPIGHFNQFR